MTEGPRQRTLAGRSTLDGIGVHTGEPASITLRGAEAGTGIVFRRTDLDGHPSVLADLRNVRDTDLGTTLADGETVVRTVEHLLAALAALRIDNALVEIDGAEVPIRDGSFADFVSAIDDAAPTEQEAPAPVLALAGPVSIDDGQGQSYVVAPSRDLRLTVSIEFDHPCIGRRSGSFAADPQAFRAELAPARTFGFQADADALRERGLALGASLDNAVVLDDERVLNDELRFDDEFVRHKAGDVIGDLALLGARLSAHVVADRPSHSGNIELARSIRAAARRSGPPVADIARIMEVLPHRYPILLVDRIVELEPGRRVVGLKNVTINEPFFQGHFPGHPVMPGVLIVEAMAQCGGMLLLGQGDGSDDKVVYFMTIDGVKFRRPVVPGDTLELELEVLQLRRGICRLQGTARVGGAVVAEAEMKAGVVDR